MQIKRVLVPAEWAGAMQEVEELLDAQERGMRLETQPLNLSEVQTPLDLHEWVRVKKSQEDPADGLDD